MQQTKGMLLPAGQDLVARAMAERGLTVADLALRLGLTQEQISDLLQGRAPLPETTAERLEQALDFDEGELLDFCHDGVVPAPLETIPPMPIRILAEPTEPIEDWAEP